MGTVEDERQVQVVYKLTRGHWHCSNFAISYYCINTFFRYHIAVDITRILDILVYKMDNKATGNHLEIAMEKRDDIEHNPGADYSGAVAKTTPEEIALVKKLDYRIMPILWAMYFLNYVRSTPAPGSPVQPLMI
jgi:hypothetical protein